MCKIVPRAREFYLYISYFATSSFRLTRKILFHVKHARPVAPFAPTYSCASWNPRTRGKKAKKADYSSSCVPPAFFCHATMGSTAGCSSGCIIASDYTGMSLVPACPPRSLTHSIATAKIVESERSLSLLINYRVRISISLGAPSCNLRERYLTERSMAYLRGARNGQLYRMTVT